MDGDRGYAWLLLGCVGVLGSVGMAALLIDTYVRHMGSGDQVGLALGMLFVTFHVLPTTGVAVLLGTVPGRPVVSAPLHSHDAMRPRIALVLRAGSICVLVLAGLYGAFELLPPAGQRDIGDWSSLALYLGSLLAFAGLLWGCAAAIVGPAATVGVPWFAAVLFATALAQAAAVVVPEAHQTDGAEVGSRPAGPGVDRTQPGVVRGRAADVVVDPRPATDHP